MGLGISVGLLADLMESLSIHGRSMRNTAPVASAAACLGALLLVQSACAQAQGAARLSREEAEWRRTYDRAHCASISNGFWVWTEKRCDLTRGPSEESSVNSTHRHRLFDGKRSIELKEVRRSKTVVEYAAPQLRVVVRLKEIGKCNYDTSNCTLQRYRAHTEIYRRGELTETVTGFAAYGS
jgi:hypothetical protein